MPNEILSLALGAAALAACYAGGYRVYRTDRANRLALRREEERVASEALLASMQERKRDENRWALYLAAKILDSQAVIVRLDHLEARTRQGKIERFYYHNDADRALAFTFNGGYADIGTPALRATWTPPRYHHYPAEDAILIRNAMGEVVYEYDPDELEPITGSGTADDPFIINTRETP